MSLFVKAPTIGESVDFSGNFQAGFARTDITPQLGVAVTGYYVVRDAKRVLDPLEAVCVAFSDGVRKALVITCDTEEVTDETNAEMKAAIFASTGLPAEAVFINATHTHTGGSLRKGWADPIRSAEENRISMERSRVYTDFTVARIADLAKAAIDDLAPAALSIARTKAERISFGRRYLMKDGKTLTNPGVLNPNIVRAVGTADSEEQLVRIDRKGKDPIAIINFQTHPDVVGGENISGDWPAMTRRTFEAALGGKAKCIFINGTQGDVNHVCVDPKAGELNGMANDFDNVYRGYEHALHMGAVVAGAALQKWFKCAPVEAGEIRCAIKDVRVASNRPKPEEIPEARHIDEMHKAGRDAELPYKGMELTTAVAGAARKLSLENGPDFFDMPLSAIAIGRSLVFCGFPGEPFNDIGVALKAQSPFKMTIPACLTNGSRGYFPFSDAYEQGGYESATSPFGPSVADDLIKGQLELINSL